MGHPQKMCPDFPGTFGNPATFRPRGTLQGEASLDHQRAPGGPQRLESRYGRGAGTAALVRASGVGQQKGAPERGGGGSEGPKTGTEIGWELAARTPPPTRRVAPFLKVTPTQCRPTSEALTSWIPSASDPLSALLRPWTSGPGFLGLSCPQIEGVDLGVGHHSAVQRQDRLANQKGTHPQRFPQPLGTPGLKRIKWAPKCGIFIATSDCNSVSTGGERNVNSEWAVPGQDHHHSPTGPAVVAGGHVELEEEARIQPNPSEVSALMWLTPDVAAAVAATEDGTETPRLLPQDVPPSVLALELEEGWKSPTSGPAHVHPAADDPNHGRGQRESQHWNQVCPQALAATSGQVKVKKDWRAPQYWAGMVQFLQA
ncbi:hypothetical protein H8959_019806 [Pygathrix nigripes]